MRHLLKTQPYEKPIAAGSFRYEQDGVPNGIIEQWRLSHALDGYRFFRIDVDARRLSPAGYSTLYNILIGPDNRPETVKFRHFSNGPATAADSLKIKGQVDLAPSGTFIFREVNGQRTETEHSATDLTVAAASWPICHHQNRPPASETIWLAPDNRFRPTITGTDRLAILQTDAAKNNYPAQVQFPSGIVAVSTRITIYR